MENRARIYHTGARYITRGVRSEIDYFTTMALWSLISKLGNNRDYLQIFELKNNKNNLIVTHKQEDPEYEKRYIIKNTKTGEDIKIFVIDDGCHSTMMLASEY